MSHDHSTAPTFMRGFNGFLPAAQVIFSKPSAKTGLPTWILIRQAGANGVIVACQDPLFGQVSGLSFEWKTLLLSRIMVGVVPQVIPDVASLFGGSWGGDAEAACPEIGTQVIAGARCGSHALRHVGP